ncbi:hypothetical protein [Gordonia soli]|uniref:Fibronectin type-III domain-containing protein n=1 Tax=Gordonia soli NBRC 108243 TaxID=1223545 RepID=M0QS29_9ACTN|nr:hypothetical protein [Gordonia soli]GAC70727.1 hypothetical protein GS4_39_00580 [Gordonia soli NBRC 108243]
MTAQTYDQVFTGNPLNVFKGLKPMVSIKDYDPAMPLTNFTPFDETFTGIDSKVHATSGTGAWGFQDLGMTDENALELDPSVTTSDTASGQYPDLVRKDGSTRAFAGSFTLIEQRPAVDALQYSLPLAALPSIGTAGYAAGPEVDITLYERTALMAAFDSVRQIWFVALFPRCVLDKPDKFSLGRKTESQTKISLAGLQDPFVKRPFKIFRGGAGWLALGGATTTVGTVTAAPAAPLTVTLSFTAPDSKNTPFKYKVYEDASSTPLADNLVTAGGTAASPVLTVTGRTAGSHTYKVQAIGSNLSSGPQSAASSPVTVTA